VLVAPSSRTAASSLPAPPPSASMLGAIATAARRVADDELGVASTSRRGGALAASLVTLVVSFRGEALPFGPWRDYVTLTKPRIMSLLLVTGAGGMFVGAGGWPAAVELVAMLLGLALACGGASALNHVIDRDIDKLMGSRTAARPVASGRVPAPRRTRVRARPLGALVRAARLDRERADRRSSRSSGNLFYVVVYTGYLKRSTDQNIVIGGAAGAGAAARRLRGRDGQPRAARAVALPDRRSSGRRRTSGRSR
jgi:hypothetical protein